MSDATRYISVLFEDQQQGGLWPVGDKGIGVIVDIAYATIQGNQLGQVHPGFKNYSVREPTTGLVFFVQPAEGGDIQAAWISGGAATRTIAVDNGNGIGPTPGTETRGLASGSNLALWFAHLQKTVGYNTANLARNVRELKGRRMEFLSVPQPERDIKEKGGTTVNRGTAPETKTDEKKGRILLINRVDVTDAVAVTVQATAGIPGVQAPAAPVAAPAPVMAPPVMSSMPSIGVPQMGGMIQTPATAPAAPAASPLGPQVQGILLEILAENPNGVEYKSLPGLVKNKIPAGTAPTDLAGILRLSVDGAFLLAGPWTYAGGIVKL